MIGLGRRISGAERAGPWRIREDLHIKRPLGCQFKQRLAVAWGLEVGNPNRKDGRFGLRALGLEGAPEELSTRESVEICAQKIVTCYRIWPSTKKDDTST